jgi:hypothetical protein
MTTQRGRLGLLDDELDDCRGIKVGRRHHRSCRRRASRTLEGGSGAREGSGGGKSATLPLPASMSPAARNRSSGVPAGSGDSSATGRPRSVISMVSPRSTWRSSSLARWRSSRIPTDVICYL